MRAGVVQMNSGDDPARNLTQAEALIRKAAAQGARLVLTPEVTNLVTRDRARQAAILQPEGTDPTLAALRRLAGDLGIWLLIGSLALAADDGAGRWHNRSFLIGPDGGIRARYDKIHMFDVELGGDESYRESSAYAPGERAVLASVDAAPEPLTLGLSICYDLRFPHLYRQLAQAGAQVLCIPSAFSPVTGRAHWEVLLRARAIENGAYVLAPAQAGLHSAVRDGGRRSWGHSLAVSPWGEILAQADGESPGLLVVDIDPAEVDRARARVPSLRQDRPFSPPGA